MCGIVGVATVSAPVDEGLLARMRDTMSHRGPDDAGLWRSADGTVGFGHRRLSIIDLSPSGHQPMTDAETGVTIVFNGEIYNYLELKAELETLGRTFQTSSDTEVLLAAYATWGTDFLGKLNGMFAFGLFEPRNQTVLLARDRAGEKPLFYRHAAGRITFASELKALLEDPSAPRVLDLESLAFYLASGYVSWDRCLLAGYRKLPQGHALLFDLATGTSRVWPYWSLPEPLAGPAADPRDLEAELERLLLDSVRLRLIADVPIGILLSGGIDSSLVTAMAARVSSKPVKTFNISFPGHRGFDEAPYARIVASHFGAEHTELAAEPASVDLLPALAHQYDEPIGDSSMLPTYLVCRLIRQHATVALGGDGGDELFGGYFHYDWLERHERLRRTLPEGFRRLAGATAEALLPVGVRGRNYLIGLSRDVRWTIAHINMFFDRRSRTQLLAAPVRGRFRAAAHAPEDWRVALCKTSFSPLQQAASVDFRTFMVDDILVKVDRASMLTSLEVRAPFLDPRVIEFAFGRVPDALRSAGGEKKILPRRLAARLLPPQLDLSRKQGFGIPLAAWFKEDFGTFVEDTLSQADSSVFDRAALQRLIRSQRRGLVNSHRLFALTMFELWRRDYRITA
jgi:asparagine synthase (glutamine-hydrolysing)